MALKKQIVWRVGVIYIFMLVFAFFIIAQIVYLQITEVTSDEDTKTLKLKNVKIAPNRGDILAADGRMLASSIPYYEIRMDTRSTGMKSKVFNSKIDSLALGLSILFRDKSAKVYKKQIMNARKNGDRFYLIKRRVDYNQLKKLKTFPIFRLGQYKGGLIVLQKNVRIKPHASLASRTIGYVRNNNVGLERAFNNELKGIAGVRLMQKISGNIWMPVHDGNEIEPKDGLDVVTTIDINIQDVAESALRKQLERQEAAYGTAVLMEVATGKIKAIVNLKRDSRGKYKERFNYAVGRRSSPGSTFKLASIIALLEDGYVALEDSVDTGNGIYKYYDKKIVDTKRGGHGKISVQKVFEVSSNVGISKLVIENYKGKEKKFINRLYELNLNNRLEVPITGEAKPDINYPGKMSASGKPLWSEISLPQMAIGYEVELTALQILTLYNAIANNGKMVKPRFVEGLMYHGNWIKTYNTEVIKQSICS
ncbi:MAG: peptidoglycan glycosyltransferase, partial [Bacteroidales bacterium]|nr:peptidoglycan glycosyltransferase [Bacteroidales bacterium]